MTPKKQTMPTWRMLCIRGSPTAFGDVVGYSHPHSFVRLTDGRLLSTCQYRAAANASAVSGGMRDGMTAMGEHETGGLEEMDEFGRPSLSGSAAATTIQDRRLYAAQRSLPFRSIDRPLSTTADMVQADTIATSQWVQLWRLSDLKLITTIALPPGPRGDENRYTGGSRLLADGRRSDVTKDVKRAPCPKIASRQTIPRGTTNAVDS